MSFLSLLGTEVRWPAEAFVTAWLRGQLKMLMCWLARHFLHAGRNLQRPGMYLNGEILYSGLRLSRL